VPRERSEILLRIGVTFAVPSEFVQWRRRARFSRVNGSQAGIYRTRNDHHEIYALITGVGARHPQSGLQELFACGVDLCIVSGLAGALKPEYRVGSILIANTVRAESNPSFIRSEAALVATASRCGAHVVDVFCERIRSSVHHSKRNVSV